MTRAHHPLMLLAAVTFSSGLFSAFLLNDAICLVMTPLVADIAMRLRRDPVPYLLAVAMASNLGSAETITGNPQNILIGSFSGISYGRFRALSAFHQEIRCNWFRCLRQRSQKARNLTWDRFKAMIEVLAFSATIEAQNKLSPSRIDPS